MNSDDKFARIAALRPAHRKELDALRVPDPPTGGDALAELLGAQVNRNHFGAHLSVKKWFATSEMCVPDERSVSLLLPQSTECGKSAEIPADPEQWLFLDTETTGLAGGTGTYAFLVGIAWWDAGGLMIEQFFMRDLDEEHSVLLELSERMAERPVLVTFNGKSFDWPLLETRYRMTRSIAAFPPAAHLDLLHPARQIWRLRLGAVRLKDLEESVLAEGGCRLDWSRQNDIDSSFIPQMYFDYLRGGPAAPLAGVFHHNQMDLRGLAALAGRIFTLLDSRNGIANAESEQDCDALDILGLSRLLRRRGDSACARELGEAALRFGLPRNAERLARRELAQLAKRDRDYLRAISLWESLQGDFPMNGGAPFLTEEGRKGFEIAFEAAEQMAIYYEHRAKDPRRALELVRKIGQTLRRYSLTSIFGWERATRLESRLARRLARLERRCAATPLFRRPAIRNRSGNATA